MALRIHPSPIRAMAHRSLPACSSKSSSVGACFIHHHHHQQQQQKERNKRVGPCPSPLRTAEEIASCLGLEMAIADLERLYRKGSSSSSSSSSIPGFGGEEPPADAADIRRRPVRVAYQGVRGSYCQEAAVKAISCSDSFPCTNMEDAFSALENRSADRAVIPAENSIDGPIDRNLDLLLRHGSVRIVGELVVPVNHCLLSLPGASRSALRRIVSHPQALSHCSGRLEALQDLDLEVEEVSSAADAARFVAENRITDTAVIGSEIAAQEFGLQVLERNFQDRTTGNFNRFLQLGLGLGLTEMGGGGAVGATGSQSQKKTTVAFSLVKGVTDLFRAMCIFERHGLRVTRVDHRPNRSNPLRSAHTKQAGGARTSYLDYVFVLDLEASSGTCTRNSKRHYSSTDDEQGSQSQVEASLARLSDISGFARVLGTYYTSTYLLN